MPCDSSQYLAFAWPPSEAAAQQAIQWRGTLAAGNAWRNLVAEPGFELWIRGRRALPFQRVQNGVVVLGDLHPLSDSPPARRQGRMAACSSKAHDLATRFWGRYVAFIKRRQDDIASIFRDPSGAIDAITWKSDLVSAASNDVIGLPAGFAPHELALDWDAITDFIRRPLSATWRMGLAGYHTVTPGDVQPMGAANSEAAAIWRPQHHAGNTFVPDAERRLSGVIRRCAHASLDDVRGVVEVSGGLDSAIVAAALGASDRENLVGLNYYGDRPEGDERRWARAACEAVGFPLIEHPKAVMPVGEADFAEFAVHARPAFNALDPDRDRDTAAFAREVGASAIFTGSGGDALFFQHPTPLVVADYRRSRGGVSLRDPLVHEVARWLRRSVWSIHGARRRVQGAGGATAALWGARAREPTAAAAHGWLSHSHELPPAKSIQVELVAAAQAASGTCRRGIAADLRHPLLSQPVIELCLSIPTWQHVAGGRDRALVRRAFAGALPDDVLQRRSKGALTSLYTRRAAASLDFLRGHLLDGVLAEAEVLDRQALDDALQPDRLIWRADGARVMGAAMVESWVRHWQGRAPDLASAARHRPKSAVV